jgi:predicted amidohydrolase YtcJ
MYGLSVSRASRACLALVSAMTLAVHAFASSEQTPAAVVLYGGHVFTAEFAHPYAEAVAIRGERIIAVGARGPVERIAGPSARKIDMQGKFLMPGMIDAHAHPIYGGMTLILANYPDTSDSVPALVQFVADQMKKNTSRVGDVLTITGIDIGYWSHAAEIDAALSSGAFAQQPIYLVGSDGHTAWANRPVRVRAGITPEFLRSLSPDEQHDYGF